MKALIFDLDDTLVETTLEHKAKVTAEVFKKLGVKPAERELFSLHHYFYNDRVYNEIGVGMESFWRAYEEFEVRHSEQRLAATRAFEDVHFLKDFKEMGFKLGIVTGCHTDVAAREIEIVYDSVGERIFDSIVIANPRSGKHAFKPDPASIFTALKEMKCDAKQSAVVGNGVEDINAGRNAGVTTILLERTEHGKNLPVKPDYHVKGLEELKKHLEIRR